MTAPIPLRIASSVRYAKDEVFEICGALASAEAALRRLGLSHEAARVAEAFQVAEAGLTS